MAFSDSLSSPGIGRSPSSAPALPSELGVSTSVFGDPSIDLGEVCGVSAAGSGTFGVSAAGSGTFGVSAAPRQGVRPGLKVGLGVLGHLQR